MGRNRPMWWGLDQRDAAGMVRAQPEPIAAEQSAVRIASPARPYRCQRSRSMTTATRTIAYPTQKDAPWGALGLEAEARRLNECPEHERDCPANHKGSGDDLGQIAPVGPMQ
jgi:hypothetical protein